MLANLTDDVPFELEMVIENGRGYVPASEQSQASQEIGIIPVDAVFSPVTRVKYEVEETRVGQKTNYDKLTMEIWTNGTVTPEMALVEAAKILRKHLNPFVGYTKPGLGVPLPGAASVFAVEAPLESRLSMLVSDLRLSLRANNFVISWPGLVMNSSKCETSAKPRCRRSRKSSVKTACSSAWTCRRASPPDQRTRLQTIEGTYLCVTVAKAES